MDEYFKDPFFKEVFLNVYSHIPRGGPGSTASIRKALSYVVDPDKGNFIPKSILNLGCGSGMETVTLAEELKDAKIVAMDLLEENINVAQERLDKYNLNDRVSAVVGDMAKLSESIPKDAKEMGIGNVDLIWSEGAAYFLEFKKAVAYWRDFLKPNGFLVVSEAVWTKEERSKEIIDFWNNEYPGIASVEQHLPMLKENGYEVVHHFTLPESDWMDNFYTPMSERIIELSEGEYKGNKKALEHLEAVKNEAEQVKKCLVSSGYEMFICRKQETI